MDLDALLMNAVIVDADTGEACGQVIGYERVGHKLRIRVVLNEEYELLEEDDPEDPEKEDIPEEEPEVKTDAKSKKKTELRVVNE